MADQEPLWQFKLADIKDYEHTSAVLPTYRVSAEIMAAEIKKRGGAEKLLDLGAGTGNSLLSILKAGVGAKLAVGLDKSLSWLEAAKEKNIKELVTANGLEMPFGDETFDCVTCVQAMHWLILAAKRDIKEPFEEVERLLKPKGLLVFDESAYHVIFDEKTDYQVNVSGKVETMKGIELNKLWYFKTIGNKLMRKLGRNSDIDTTYKGKNGYHSWKPEKIRQAARETGFDIETLVTLIPYTREQMQAALEFNEVNLLPGSEQGKGKIGEALKQVKWRKSKPYGEILVHYICQKN